MTRTACHEEDCLDQSALTRLHRLGGATFVREMIDLYFQCMPPKITASRAAVEAGDFVGVERAAHFLKFLVGRQLPKEQGATLGTMFRPEIPQRDWVACLGGRNRVGLGFGRRSLMTLMSNAQVQRRMGAVEGTRVALFNSSPTCP